MAEKKVNKLINKLRLKDFKLQSLLDVTKAINNNYSIEKLLEIYEFILREQLGITQLILFNKDTEWDCILTYGAKDKDKSIEVEKDLLHIREITVVESSSPNTLTSFDVVVPVHHKNIPLAYLLIGDLNENAIAISPTIKHMPFIQTLTNIIVVAIENKRFAKSIIRQERVRKELEVASEMQALLLPNDLPSDNKVDAAAFYLAHQKVGGDYYDFIQINDDEFVFCMADVSGKGISAALLMSNFQANLRAIINYNDYSLKKVISELNRTVMENAKGEKFITFFIGKYNLKTKKLKYINAGHNHPILTDGQTFKMLNIGATGLGMFDELPFIQEEEVTISPNSIIVCYTDGVVELENEEGEAFETDNLRNLITENFTSSMEDLNKIIFKKLKFFGKGSYLDDIAILSCRIF